VVVDAGSGRPVVDVLVAVQNTDLQAITDEAGRFSIRGVPLGSARLVFRHIAYGEQSRELVFEDTGLREILVRISPRAIELAPLELEVRSLPFGASGNSIDLIDRETIDLFEIRGETLVNILGREVPGIRINSGCVEYRLQTRSRGIGYPDSIVRPLDPVNETCRELTVYLDGVRQPDASAILQAVPLSNLESIEVLSPSEASVRYGADGGVLLLESRRGFAPESVPNRVTYTGFGWHDPEPYRWPRVLGVSLVAQAAATIFAFRSFMECDSEDAHVEGRTTCTSAFAAGAGAAAGTMGGLLTGWAGKAPFTQGRTLPLVAVGILSATASYLLLIDAEKNDSDLAGWTGMALAATGTSILTTLTDRIFRIVR
jgi:hypothetical protein